MLTGFWTRVPIQVIKRNIYSMFAYRSSPKFMGYDPTAWEKCIRVEELQEIYDAQGWSGDLGEWRQRSVDRLEALILEMHAEMNKEVQVLDVACFGGDYFGRLCRTGMSREKFQYTGVDVTPKYVAYAAKRWQNYPNAKFLVGSAFDLPFDDNTFDIVFNSGMLIHVDSVEGCLQEFNRVGRRRILMETTTIPDLSVDFIDNGGGRFINRVYRLDYIREEIASRGVIVKETIVPYKSDQSVLFEVLPNLPSTVQR